MNNRGSSVGMTLSLIVVVIAFVMIGSALLDGNKSTVPSSSKTTEVSLPEATGYVVDQANILKSETKQKAEATLKSLDSKAQIAVVTVVTTQPLDEKQYAMKLAEKWKPGYKGKDNGIIFLIVTGDRKVRIEVGRGLEGSINDAKAGRILDDAVVPFLKKGDWDGGVLSGIDAIAKNL